MNIVAGIEAIDVVPGRCEILDEGQDFSVIVDAAETPEALGGSCEGPLPVRIVASLWMQQKFLHYRRSVGRVKGLFQSGFQRLVDAAETFEALSMSYEGLPPVRHVHVCACVLGWGASEGAATALVPSARCHHLSLSESVTAPSPHFWS